MSRIRPSRKKAAGFRTGACREFGGLPDLYTFECEACGETHVEEDGEWTHGLYQFASAVVVCA
jgi:hypothetical protein